MKAEYKDEKSLVFKFLLSLYVKRTFTANNGLIPAKTLRTLFQSFCQNENIPLPKNSVKEILERNKLTIPNFGRNNVCIKTITFLRSYHAHLEELDHKQKSARKEKPPNDDENSEYDSDGTIINDPEEHELEFRSAVIRKNDESFQMTNLGCIICHQNFRDQQKFDDHIAYHRDINNSNDLDFKIRTELEGVILQKIILVLNSFVYVNLYELPSEMSEDGEFKFSVDRNGLTLNVRHPLVIIFNTKNSTDALNMEQYVFFRTEEYPQSTLNLRSVKLPPREQLLQRVQMPKIKPEMKLIEISKIQSEDGFLSALKEYSWPISNFLQHNILTSSNFVPVLDSFLQIYDLSVQKVYQSLYRENATVQGAAGEFSTTVENLRDNITLDKLVSPFDIIVLQDNSLQPPKTYKGLIYKVYKNKVIFSSRAAKQKDKLHPGKNFTIKFLSARLKFLYQYHALRTVSSPLRNYLFPSKITPPPSVPFQTLEIFNKTIETNPEQLQAVLNIAGKGSWDNQSPYVIFGPPGTGKTTTVVESILQVFHASKDHKILVSANSNAACDEVAKRIKKFLYSGIKKEPVLLRVYSGTYGRKLDQIDEDLFEATNVAHEYHIFPTLEVFKSYRIIVATHDIACKYYHSFLKNNDKVLFSHIFIDENGASTIPEALCSVVGYWSRSTRLILSGDPKQLSALIEDTRTRKLGFEVSLMERLMETPVYRKNEDGSYNVDIQSRLRRNYRCHGKILNLFSTLCYNGELLTCGSTEKLNKAVGWFKLVNADVPVIFDSSYDYSMTQPQQTSMFNGGEIKIVMQYVKELMFLGLNGQEVTEKDIGIVSPYKKQCLMIKEELESRNWFHIEVGSAETYQGKEKPIIIMSTVRSGTKSIGFLDNIRRLNVMISRAEALLIMVGNPDTLSLDSNWEKLIDACKTLGVFNPNVPLKRSKRWKSVA